MWKVSLSKAWSKNRIVKSLKMCILSVKFTCYKMFNRGAFSNFRLWLYESCSLITSSVGENILFSKYVTWVMYDIITTKQQSITAPIWTMCKIKYSSVHLFSWFSVENIRKYAPCEPGKHCKRKRWLYKALKIEQAEHFTYIYGVVKFFIVIYSLFSLYNHLVYFNRLTNFKFMSRSNFFLDCKWLLLIGVYFNDKIRVIDKSLLMYSHCFILFCGIMC